MVWNFWNTNVAKELRPIELLSFAWQWKGEKTVHCLARSDFRDKTDKSLAKALHKLLDSADIVIAHNGISFDDKKSYYRFLVHDLEPLPKLNSFDTKRELKNKFGFTSNSLDYVCHVLGIGRKLKHPGIDMWDDCMHAKGAAREAAFAKLKKYNKHDIFLLKGLEKRIGKWCKFPNVRILMGYAKNTGCPYCTHEGFKLRGYRGTETMLKRDVKCLNPECGKRYLIPMPKEAKK